MDVDDDPTGRHAVINAADTNRNNEDNLDTLDTLHSLDGALEADHLRILSRSPHPYHHNNADLPHPAHRIASFPHDPNHPSDTEQKEQQTEKTKKDFTPASDSGTEADDEHFLKGLPAPRAKPRKGLRGMNEVLSGVSTPLSPAFKAGKITTPPPDSGSESVACSVSVCGDISCRRRTVRPANTPAKTINDTDRRQGKGKETASRRRREIARRSTELLLLVSLAALLFSNPAARPLLFHWRFELQAVTFIVLGLLVLYPLRVVVWAYRTGSKVSITIPASFDPAPLFYPLAIPVLVAFLLATPTLPAAPLLNLVLSVCALPKQLIPFSVNQQLYDPVQWLLSCVPVFVATQLLPSEFKEGALSSDFASISTSAPPFGALSPDVAGLLYPLHQTLCWLLYDLTTTSLLPAELQLLSAALINLLVLAMSPQAVILQALLWGGGLAMLVAASSVVRWGIMLARIPRWRFSREQDAVSESSLVASFFSRVWLELKSLRRARLEMMYGPRPGGSSNAPRRSGSDSSDFSPFPREKSDEPAAALTQRWPDQKAHITVIQDDLNTVEAEAVESPIANTDGVHELPPRFSLEDPAVFAAMAPHWKDDRSERKRSPATTPSGRRKRTMSMSARAFFSLTYAQAVRRKWMYAGYLYVCIAVVILVPLRAYIGAYALRGHEPFGWALGYLFGGLDGFRLEIVKANLEGWVCLPERFSTEACHVGWVEHVRHAWIGPATTRLLLFAYWGLVILFGLAVVFTLSPVYEVDTRRKVFHFMMVAVLLPATFVDPAFAGLALALVLSVFLLLDLLRASQLPPLSRPIAAFLTPYVDGRDLRGPVVISHIFLLIGCAIPLWLSLASVPRSVSSDCSTGWEVPTRDVSMVSGVICVGLGDAAASLIGRRWGRRKWVWGGGKSLEGSIAFATAVFAGLMAASLWLRVGGWTVTGEGLSLVSSETVPTGSIDRIVAWIGGRAAQAVAPRAGVCAVVTSLTEAVLTGGNDNVVVPVILWTCVKSFGL